MRPRCAATHSPSMGAVALGSGRIPKRNWRTYKRLPSNIETSRGERHNYSVNDNQGPNAIRSLAVSCQAKRAALVSKRAVRNGVLRWILQLVSHAFFPNIGTRRMVLRMLEFSNCHRCIGPPIDAILALRPKVNMQQQRNLRTQTHKFHATHPAVCKDDNQGSAKAAPHTEAHTIKMRG